MLNINEQTDQYKITPAMGKILTSGGFSKKGNVYYFKHRDPDRDMFFHGFIYVFNSRYASIGVTFNADIGFVPHMKEIFGSYFFKYFCDHVVSYTRVPYDSLVYSSTLDLYPKPMHSLVGSKELDLSKADPESFMNALVLAGKELKSFLKDFIKDGHSFVGSTYSPKFLKGVPRTRINKDKPVAYSRKLRR